MVNPLVLTSSYLPIWSSLLYRFLTCVVSNWFHSGSNDSKSKKSSLQHCYWYHCFNFWHMHIKCLGVVTGDSIVVTLQIYNTLILFSYLGYLWRWSDNQSLQISSIFLILTGTSNIIVWFSLFNGILTPYGLVNAEISFICKCLIINITIILIFFYIFIIILFHSSIIICLNRVIWYQVFLSNPNNNLHTFIWYQVFLSNANDLPTVIWYQVFLSNPNNNLHTFIWYQVFLSNPNNNLHTFIWYQVFLSNPNNNLHTFIWYQVFLSNTNDLPTVIWYQVFLSNTNNLQTIIWFWLNNNEFLFSLIPISGIFFSSLFLSQSISI